MTFGEIKVFVWLYFYFSNRSLSFGIVLAGVTSETGDYPVILSCSFRYSELGLLVTPLLSLIDILSICGSIS